MFIFRARYKWTRTTDQSSSGGSVKSGPCIYYHDHLRGLYMSEQAVSILFLGRRCLVRLYVPCFLSFNIFIIDKSMKVSMKSSFIILFLSQWWYISKLSLKKFVFQCNFLGLLPGLLFIILISNNESEDNVSDVCQTMSNIFYSCCRYGSPGNTTKDYKQFSEWYLKSFSGWLSKS